jgi:endoglucanase
MPAIWDQYWGFLTTSGEVPLLLGEFGTFAESDEDLAWLGALLDFVRQRNLSFSYWCLNPNSADTGGLLLDDWRTLHSAKHAVLNPLLLPAAKTTGWVPTAAAGAAASVAATEEEVEF